MQSSNYCNVMVRWFTTYINVYSRVVVVVVVVVVVLVAVGVVVVVVA